MCKFLMVGSSLGNVVKYGLCCCVIIVECLLLFVSLLDICYCCGGMKVKICFVDGYIYLKWGFDVF